MNPPVCARHTWVPSTDGTLYVCADCPEETGACHTCGAALVLANLVCARCLDRARETLADIQVAANTPYTYGTLGIKAVRYDGERTSGSRGEDPRGSTPATGLDQLLAEMAPGGGVDIITILRDPPNVLEPLLDWADRWAEARGETAHGMNVFAYLDTRLLWAANTPDTSAWHDFLNEARVVRSRLRRLVGLAPDHAAAPCVHCGGEIVQEQTELHGLEERLKCTGCHMTWRDREHLAAIGARAARLAAHLQPDTLVTVEQARAALPHVKRNTLNQALKRDRAKPEPEQRAPERGRTRRDEPTYRLGDLADLMAPVVAPLREAVAEPA